MEELGEEGFQSPWQGLVLESLCDVSRAIQEPGEVSNKPEPEQFSPCTRAVRQAEGSHFQGNTGALPPAEVRS